MATALLLKYLYLGLREGDVMKRMLLFISLLGGLSACATPPLYMVDNFQGKKITRCDNDAFCFRETYSVAWDHSCRINGYEYRNNCDLYWNGYEPIGFPVTYRSKEYVYVNDPSGYAVTLPGGGAVALPKDKIKDDGGGQ